MWTISLDSPGHVVFTSDVKGTNFSWFGAVSPFTHWSYSAGNIHGQVAVNAAYADDSSPLPKATNLTDADAMVWPYKWGWGIDGSLSYLGSLRKYGKMVKDQMRFNR